MSFFDDDGEETAQQPAARAHALASPPRTPGAAGPRGVDDHTLIVRRRVALGAGVALLIVIALVVNGCVKSEKTQELKDYNQSVGQIARESSEQVATPLFTTLSSASTKQALEVEEQVDQLRIQAQGFASRVQGLKRPQRDGGRAAEPVAGLQPARGNAREAGGAAAEGAGRQRQAVDRIHRRGDGDVPRLRHPLLPAGRAPDPADAGRTRSARRPDEPLAVPPEPRVAGTQHRQLQAHRAGDGRALRPPAGPTAAR